ncbi:TOBE domain-containing protein [Pseudomonas sp. RIT-PI-AD]|uniref:TOBE domain-containing protein n=1 Tax=Pseudomonas sp. RIT-PI-AD TaxID=3035294 RepID=UPI0021DB706B|nr:TOBE domain-containing protein [Pseudomonas sp. RIT-PI-AD]
MNPSSPLADRLARRPQRLALLAQVAAQGSITRAAKAVGLSYKAAWDAIDELNNLADAPLVERSVGGRGGGGARLTAEGERVLALYQRLEQVQARMLESAGQERDLELLGRLLLRTSARNQLGGRVRAIHPQGRNDLIEIELNGGARIRARITRASTENLGLENGSRVIALMKAGGLEVQPPASPVAPDGNALDGRIERLLAADEGPWEVRIGLPGGQTLCALCEARRLREQALDEGSPVRVTFAAAQVLLGTPL